MGYEKGRVGNDGSDDNVIDEWRPASAYAYDIQLPLVYSFTLPSLSNNCDHRRFVIGAPYFNSSFPLMSIRVTSLQSARSMTLSALVAALE